MNFTNSAARWIIAAVAVGASFVSLNMAAGQNDRFGVKMLHATVSGGREWFANWDEARTIDSGKTDASDSLFRNSEGKVSISGGVATAPAAQTRFYILTPKDDSGAYTQPLWKNVEMTAYVRRGMPTQTMSWQALDFSARSGERHNDAMPCDGTSYHGDLRLDGKCGFKKEIWHTGGYTDLGPTPTPKPWKTVPESEWVGMKFVCRNCDDDQHVKLALYNDQGEANNWTLVSELTDAGGWNGRRESCERPKDFILTDAYPAVYFRTDYLSVEVKKFSVREVAALP